MWHRRRHRTSLCVRRPRREACERAWRALARRGNRTIAHSVCGAEWILLWTPIRERTTMQTTDTTDWTTSRANDHESDHETDTEDMLKMDSDHEYDLLTA